MGSDETPVGNVAQPSAPASRGAGSFVYAESGGSAAAGGAVTGERTAHMASPMTPTFAIQLKPERFCTITPVAFVYDKPVRFAVDLYDHSHEEEKPLFHEHWPSLAEAYMAIFDFARNAELYICDVFGPEPLDTRYVVECWRPETPRAC